MLFELRITSPDVSPAWRNIRDDFLNGRTRSAWTAAVEARGQLQINTANDWLLNIEIARACSATKTYLALVRMAARRFPNDHITQLYVARVALTRGRFMQGIEYLESLESTLGQTHTALWGTELANIHASAGFEASCNRWLDRIANAGGMDAPLALYTQACTQEGNRNWDKAIELAQRCVDAAPNWSRARGYYAHCLLARGRVDDAVEQLEEATSRGHEEHLIDLSRAMVEYALGHFDVAQQLLEEIWANWPMADLKDWVRRSLCILYVEAENPQAAKRLADGDEEKLSLPPIPDKLTQPHLFTPLPLVAQNKNQCVPTTVAMAAYPQGGRFDPAELFTAMHGREGTALWRMREWSQQNGYDVIAVDLKLDSIVNMLDAGIPLIGILEGVFNSHVDVICGYNRDLEVIYVRDPVHWTPIAWPFKDVVERYELHGGVLAVVSQSNSTALTLANSLRSEPCNALIDLSEATAKGNMTDAEAAYAKIADESPTAFLRDSYACNVLIGPQEQAERLKAIAANSAANRSARFRSLMSSPSEDVREILEQLAKEEDNARYLYFVRRYLDLMCNMQDGHWTSAREQIDRLMLTGSSVSFLWDLLADVCFELGQHEDSQRALDRAIEIEPQRLSYREKALFRSGSKLTYEEYLQQFEKLLEEDPEDHRLLWGRATALLDGPDGLTYEQAVEAHIRWYPRDPGGYFALLNWYSGQQRDDLCDAMLDRAHKMLPDVFEKNKDSDSAETDSEAATVDASKEDSEHPAELPTEVADMLRLIWEESNPQRAEVLGMLLKRQNENALRWNEHADLIACRLLVEDDDWQDNEPPYKDILPKTLSGPVVWFAYAVVDTLTGYSPSIATAKEVERWLEQIVPDYTNHVELWFNHVLLLEHQMQMEEALKDLQALLDRYPKFSAALYRMGTVEFQQDDYPQACKYMERALDVNPGLYGSMNVLRSVYQTLDQPSETLRYVQMLRKKVPYLFEWLKDEAFLVANLQSHAAATELIDQAQHQFGKNWIAVLRAQLASEQVGFAEAAELLTALDVESDDFADDLYDEFLQTRIHVASQLNQTSVVIDCCDEGLKRFPDSTRLKELKADVLAETNPTECQEILKELLLTGQPTAQTAWQYLSLSPNRPDKAAKDIVLAAASDRRSDLADLFVQVMNNGPLLSWLVPFSEWALEKMPEADSIRWRLAGHLTLANDPNKAVHHAEILLERNPDSMEARQTLGRCLIDKDAKEGLKHLEEVCTHNRSVDNLFDLARCHQILGDSKQSVKLHWEILESNPLVACSWANLYLANESGSKLWTFVEPILRAHRGHQDEYFLVSVVKLAVKDHHVLPVEWLDLAMERYELLQTLPGFLDEKPLLKKCLLAWFAARPNDRARFPAAPSSWLGALASNFRWPGRSWIPKE